jgi:hypothetical protein
MKICISILSIVLVCPVLSRAQAVTVSWGQPGFTTVYMNGMAVERYEGDGLRIDVLPPILDKSRHVYSVFVAIFNHRREYLDIDPAQVRAQATDRDQVALLPLDGDKEVSRERSSAERKVKTQAAFAGMAGAGGDTLATQRAIDNVEQSRASGKALFDELSDHVLRRNTVPPGSLAAGRVYFAAPKGLSKKAQVTAISVTVDGTSYVFNWDDGKPPKRD